MKNIRAQYWLLLIVSCLLVVVLSACSSEAEQFIQGKWGIGNAHYWAEWNFDNGFYWYESGYTQEPMFERGRYNVIESGTDYIVLELFDQEGGIPSIEDRVEIRIEFNYQQDSIHLRRTDYYRVDASSLEALATSRAP